MKNGEGGSKASPCFPDYCRSDTGRLHEHLFPPPI
jgi:hypothetical protein